MILALPHILCLERMDQSGDTMKPSSEMRKSGIELVGDLPWGTHFCQFYETKEDLLTTLIPYFRAGLENNEFCVWVTSGFLTKEDALEAMNKGVRRFSEYLEKGQIEILSCTDFYLKGGKFDPKRTLHALMKKYDEALLKGFEGMRGSGNLHWIGNKKDWDDCACYEAEINNVIRNTKLLAMCTYSIEKCGVVEILDVVKNHYRPSPKHSIPVGFM